MRSSRQFRFVAALIALLSMLFTQLAVASYVCPNKGGGQDQAVVTMTPVSAPSGMNGCAGLDVEQPSLCHAHGQVGNQSLDKPDLPQVQPFIAVGLMQALTYLDTAYRPSLPQPRALALTRATAPPLTIRNCCFRI